ncbi:MAG: ABC transporter ATP-binding protein, partial [Flavobacterium sp.]
MSDIVIEVKNVSKLYRLGKISAGSFKQELSTWWNMNVLKKQGSSYQAILGSEMSENHFWSLKDICFDVREGEVVGLIGNNGSGKSTLLKIISRIISPTKGVIRGRGKIRSILEVGTGFNPDLTGRQNIFMSGYILGMSRKEIQSKFDEIVAFSGVERFLDTPVKRYSSGMYVRLAFAVAAHLEPDILIIDEVLAVGDAEFQQKCLGKMKEVSKSKGRTILFVSHDIHAVANLCNRAIWLEKGSIKETGSAMEVADHYLLSVKSHGVDLSWKAEEAPGNTLLRMHSISISALDNNRYITVHTPI